MFQTPQSQELKPELFSSLPLAHATLEFVALVDDIRIIRSVGFCMVKSPRSDVVLRRSAATVDFPA